MATPKGFDPKKYGHLEKAPLVVFVTEFLKRNHLFLADIKKYQPATVFDDVGDSVKMRQYFLAEYGIVADFEVKFPKAGDTRFPKRPWRVTLPPPVHAIRTDDGSEYCNRLYFKIHEHNSDTPSSSYMKLVSPNDFIEKPIPELFWAAYQTIPSSKAEARKQYSKKLLLMLNLETPLEELVGTVERLISLNKVPGENRRRFRWWKDYLITYDLRKKTRMSYREIADLFLEQFKIAIDEKNLSRYVDKCEALIMGGYRRYL